MRRLTLVPTTALFVSSVAVEADAGARRSRPVKTGQVTCWDSEGDVIDCAGTGQDGDLRRGEPRAYVDNGDGTIRDKRTALTWEKLSDDDSVHDRDNSYSWAEAFRKITTPNSPPCFAGFCDWRLPNSSELYSIVNHGNGNPAVSAQYKTNCEPGCTVLLCSCTALQSWSSSSNARSPHYAWGVDFFEGHVLDWDKKNPRCVRAVRGGS